MTGKEPRHLFVYGKLMGKSKSPYAQILRARATFVDQAYIAGRLYHLGSYPGAVPDDACSMIVLGELYRLKIASLLHILDRYEGCNASDPQPHLFKREIIATKPVSGSLTMSWVYSFCGSVAGRPRIVSGRFR